MLRSVFYGLLVLSLLFSPLPCYAEYTMTEEELTILEGNLIKLEQITETSSQELTMLKNQLNKSEDELTSLNNQLNELRTINERQSQSLMKANQYLSQYEKEVKAERKKLKFQRNVGYVVAFIALTVAIAR